jgi:pyridoxal phosphate enzyme (YggS family)
MTDIRETVALNAVRVREAVAGACSRSGRSPDRVRIVAVTKGHPVAAVEAARAAGFADIGENRVAEAAAKAPMAGTGLTWHLIGHLQTNKVRKALGVFEIVHSLDRASLAEAVQAEAGRADRRVRCFLQVNTSGEASKGGFARTEAEDAVRRIQAFDRIELIGLMTMAPLSADPEASRPVFRALRELRDALRRSVPGAAGLEALSMGMSQDYRVAVEEGATHLRIGTAIFGPNPAVP